MARKILNRHQRHILLKFLALLSLVRWYNILLVVISQYLTAIFILNPKHAFLTTILDYRLLLLALSSAFLIAGGYIINSFYDLEKDLVNQPKKIIIAKYISKWFALNCYFLFSFLGLFCSFFVSYRILLFNAIFLFLLWIYSHKLKKIAFVGNLSATILSILPFFGICVYYNKINLFILCYVSFIFLIEFTREILKDLGAMKGDLIFGYKTLPLTIGVKRTKTFVYFLMLLSTIPPLLLIFDLNNPFVTFYFALSGLLLIISSLKLNKSETKQNFHQLNNIYKTIIVLGIGSILFF